MAKTNVRYFYKGHVYLVKYLTKIKTAAGWVAGVDYYRENEPNGEVFSRGREQFDERFTPFTLSEGDEVVVLTMGKVRAVLKVDYINGDIAECSNDSNFKLSVKTAVDAEHGGLLEVVGWKPQASDICYHTQAIRIREARDAAEATLIKEMSNIKEMIPTLDEAAIIQLSNILSTLSDLVKSTLGK